MITSWQGASLSTLGAMILLWVGMFIFAAASVHTDMADEFEGTWRIANLQIVVDASKSIQVSNHKTGEQLGSFAFSVYDGDSITIKTSGTYKGAGAESARNGSCRGSLALANNSQALIVNLNKSCDHLNGTWSRWKGP